MKFYLGMALELIGVGLISYALYTLAPWAGLIAAGVFAVLIGISLGGAHELNR